MKKQFTEDSWPAERWPNFSFLEMACRHSGLCYLDEEMMDNLQDMRMEYNKPMKIISGYRHRTHPVEEAKEKPGAHYTGKAVDIRCYGAGALLLIELAVDFSFDGIGVKQHGPHAERFIHIDRIEAADNFHAERPWIWSYSAS
jgi:zinc D-Ala-D-Ala carboxypeptidase